MPWNRKWQPTPWQPTPVFLPGKFHGQRRLVGYSPWGCKESDMTEWLNWTELTVLHRYPIFVHIESLGKSCIEKFYWYNNFQQHLLTLCLCHILVIFIRFHTFSLFLHLLMVICDHHLLYCSNLELNLQYLRGMPVCLISLWIPSEWMKVLVAQSCLTLCNPMDYSPPGSSVHGILQARKLEWVAIP